MGKIKGWSRAGRNYWRNDFTKRDIWYQEEPLGPVMGQVLIVDLGFDTFKVAYAGTEKEIRKKAIDYMRRHPRGY